MPYDSRAFTVFRQEVRDWSATLSAGERQRLAFARLFMMLVAWITWIGHDMIWIYQTVYKLMSGIV